MHAKVVLHQLDNQITVLDWTEGVSTICCTVIRLILRFHGMIIGSWYADCKSLLLHALLCALACEDGNTYLDGIGVIAGECHVCIVCLLIIYLLRNISFAVVWIHAAIRTEILVNKSMLTPGPPDIVHRCG